MSCTEKEKKFSNVKTKPPKFKRFCFSRLSKLINSCKARNYCLVDKNPPESHGAFRIMMELEAGLDNKINSFSQ